MIQEAFDDAKSGQNWQMLDSEKMYKEFKQVHYNIQQRWLVVRSQASIHKAEESVKKALEKETTEVEKKVFHMEAQEFDNLEQAKKDSDRLIIDLNGKFHKSSEIKKASAENKIVQMKEAAIKEIKDASVKIAVDSVKKIITTSVDKSKLDNLFQKNLEETKEELKKINS